MGFQFPYWEHDPQFQNFNFSQLIDPALSYCLSEPDLYRLAYPARAGSQIAIEQFANAMHFTLGPVAFQSFQQKHGPRPIEYKDWFYNKLHQFLTILISEHPGVDPASGQPVTYSSWETGAVVLHINDPQPDPDAVEAAFDPQGDAEFV